MLRCWLEGIAVAYEVQHSMNVVEISAGCYYLCPPLDFFRQLEDLGDGSSLKFWSEREIFK
jgi:hypothetical protein